MKHMYTKAALCAALALSVNTAVAKVPESELARLKAEEAEREAQRKAAEIERRAEEERRKLEAAAKAEAEAAAKAEAEAQAELARKRLADLG